MKLFGRDVHWSEPPRLQQRSLEQITDIDIAFTAMQASMLGLTDSSVPALFRARQLLTDTVASLPLEAVVGQVVSDDTPQVLEDPDPSQSYHDTMSEIMLSLVDEGNAYLWVRTFDKTGNPKSIKVLDPNEVSVNWDRNRLYRTYSWRDKGMTEGKDLIHIAINRRPGDLLGKGPVDAARYTTLRAAQAEEVLARTMAEDNYTPSLVLRTGKATTQAEAKAILDVWMSTRDSEGGRKRPAVLGGPDAGLEQVTFSPVDAQWIESRNFTVQQIGRLLGVHGFFLLVDSGSSLTYSTTESLFRLMLTATLRPTYLERIEQHFSRLLPSGTKARFNTSEILRADMLSRYQANQIALGQKGFKTVNEVRAEEGLSAIPNGDELIAVSVQPKELSMNGASA